MLLSKIPRNKNPKDLFKNSFSKTSAFLNRFFQDYFTAILKEIAQGIPSKKLLQGFHQKLHQVGISTTNNYSCRRSSNDSSSNFPEIPPENVSMIEPNILPGTASEIATRFSLEIPSKIHRKFIQ